MLNFIKKVPLNFKKSQVDIDPEGINFLDLGYGRTTYETEMGEAPPEGMFFVDIDEKAGPDVLWDLDEGIPLPDSSIGGTIHLGHIIMYLQNPEFVAQEVLRVAKSGTSIEIGTYIPTKDALADAETWEILPTEIEELTEEAAQEEDPKLAEVNGQKTYAFINALSKGTQLIERDFSGVYLGGAHVFFTFQVV